MNNLVKTFFILALLNIPSVSCTIENQTTSGKTIAAKKEQWNLMSDKVNLVTDGLGMPIDPGIKEAIIVLNLLGFKTSASCEGHVDHGCANPWIDFDIEDSNIDNLLQKEKSIFEIIEKKEKNLENKFSVSLSGIDVQKEDPELILLWNEHYELSEKVKYLYQMKIINLKKLIEKFYKNYFPNYDRILILHNFGSSFFRLMSLGGNWQISQDTQSKLKKLQEYQDEMNLFAKFLINYYWSDQFDPQMHK